MKLSVRVLSLNLSAGGGGCKRREVCQGETQSWAQGAGLRCPGTRICGREKEMEFTLQCLVPLQWEVRCPRGGRLQSQARLPEGTQEDGPLAAQDWDLARHQLEAAETGTSESSAQKYLPRSRHCRKEELHST